MWPVYLTTLHDFQLPGIFKITKKQTNKKKKQKKTASTHTCTYTHTYTYMYAAGTTGSHILLLQIWAISLGSEESMAPSGPIYCIYKFRLFSCMETYLTFSLFSCMETYSLSVHFPVWKATHIQSVFLYGNLFTFSIFSCMENNSHSVYFPVWKTTHIQTIFPLTLK